MLQNHEIITRVSVENENNANPKWSLNNLGGLVFLSRCLCLFLQMNVVLNQTSFDSL